MKLNWITYSHIHSIKSIHLFIWSLKKYSAAFTISMKENTPHSLLNISTIVRVFFFLRAKTPMVFHEQICYKKFAFKYFLPSEITCMYWVAQRYVRSAWNTLESISVCFLNRVAANYSKQRTGRSQMSFRQFVSLLGKVGQALKVRTLVTPAIIQFMSNVYFRIKLI